MNLTPEEATILRRELIKRAKILCDYKGGNDWHYNFDESENLSFRNYGPDESKVNRLFHYMEKSCSDSTRNTMALCLAYLKNGEIKLHRHYKGKCPYMVYKKAPDV